MPDPARDLVAILAEPLRLAHGGVGLRKHLFDVVAGMGERQPDAHGHGVVVSVEIDGYGEHGLDALGYL